MKKYVVVTTDKRGVFCGRLDGAWTRENVRLTDARMCVWWARDVRGVLGLAASGPNDACRVTPAVPMAEIIDVTAVFDCTPEAVERWKAEPWNG